jgi:hypothetical protein
MRVTRHHTPKKGAGQCAVWRECVLVSVWRRIEAVFPDLPILVHQPFRALGLLTRFQAAFSAGSNPLHGVGVGGDESGFGTPGDDELPGSATTGDAMDNDGFFRLMMLIHQVHEAFDLGIGRNTVVGNVEVVVLKVAGHVLPIVELAAIDDRLDLVCLVDVKNIGVGPPGSSDDVFHDPGEGFGSFGLSPFGPIPGADGLWHVFRCHLFTEIVYVSI